MTGKKTVILMVIFACFLQIVDASGYGGGHSYMVPGGSRGRKWSIRAKGKGMQNMMKMPSYKKEEKDDKKVVYYPVPVYSKSKKYGGEDEYETKQQMSIIPISGYGKMGGGYGGYGKMKGGYEDAGGYGGYEERMGFDGFGYDDYGSSANFY